MSTSDSCPVLEFRGRMLSMSLLRVHTNNLDEIAERLREQLTRSALLRELPIALDLQVQIIDVEGLLAILRKEQLKVLGAIRGAASMEAAVRRTGLAVIQDPGQRGKAEATPESKAAPKPAPAPQAPPPPPEPEAEPFSVQVHTQPVRSGRQVYVRAGDLTLTAQVGAGAEVIADGNIHIYGTLRGRAIAGAQGDTKACIFCRSLEAELVAIAGTYMVADDIPADMRGRPVQIRLDGSRLDFRALD
ncbi:MAG: septum site-determining protein MinC [Oceanococcaceae bacterium]